MWKSLSLLRGSELPRQAKNHLKWDIIILLQLLLQQEFTSYLGVSTFYDREAELVIYSETPASNNAGSLPGWANTGPLNKKTQNYNSEEKEHYLMMLLLGWWKSVYDWKVVLVKLNFTQTALMHLDKLLYPFFFCLLWCGNFPWLIFSLVLSAAVSL